MSRLLNTEAVYCHIDGLFLSIMGYPEQVPDMQILYHDIIMALKDQYLCRILDCPAKSPYSRQKMITYQDGQLSLLYGKRWYKDVPHKQVIGAIRLTSSNKKDYRQHHEMIRFIENVVNRTWKDWHFTRLEISLDACNEADGHMMFKAIMPKNADKTGLILTTGKPPKQGWLLNGEHQYYQTRACNRQFHTYPRPDESIWRAEITFMWKFLKSKAWKIRRYEDIMNKILRLIDSNIAWLSPCWSKIQALYQRSCETGKHPRFTAMNWSEYELMKDYPVSRLLLCLCERLDMPKDKIQERLFDRLHLGSVFLPMIGPDKVQEGVVGEPCLSLLGRDGGLFQDLTT